MARILTTRGEMDTADLLLHEQAIDNDHERTTIVEYCVKGCDGAAHLTGVPDQPFCFCSQHVHRSADVTIKEWPEGLGGLIGDLH
jgi:hypothetical protein